MKIHHFKEILSQHKVFENTNVLNLLLKETTIIISPQYKHIMSGRMNHAFDKVSALIIPLITATSTYITKGIASILNINSF